MQLTFPSGNQGGPVAVDAERPRPATTTPDAAHTPIASGGNDSKSFHREVVRRLQRTLVQLEKQRAQQQRALQDAQRQAGNHPLAQSRLLGLQASLSATLAQIAIVSTQLILAMRAASTSDPGMALDLLA